MPRIPMLPGLRLLVPRPSFISRPLLPLTSRLTGQRSAASAQSVSLSSWRMFSYSRPASRSSPPPPSSSSSSSSSSEDHAKYGSGPGPDATVSQRLRYLIKTYGWYALGVYICISTIDFTIAFAAINVLGAEQVSRVTDVVKQRISSLLHSIPSEPGKQEYETSPPGQNGNGSGGGGGRESLYAMLVLAYTVHKTLFLPIRVGLTAAFTPRIVGWLSRRGWAGGEGTRRAAREMRERLRRDRDRD